ncbi:MAG TPA: exosortase/archaeosortase family protein [Candidatus Sulfotelmatobacter sp.]|nr:exosortase/archaeosortase family protein [Candidatus Sulfotelmatobacter sp.]
MNDFLKSANKNLRAGYKLVIAFALVALTLIIIYGNDFSVLANEILNDEALTHLLIMPFLAGFLFYLKKDAVKAAVATRNGNSRRTYTNGITGTILCVIAFLLYIYGSSTFYPLEYHLTSLPIFIAGITLILLNPQVLKIIAIPLLFLFFLIPLPALITNPIGGALANINTQTSYTIMHTLGLPVTLSYDYGAPAILLSNQAGQPLAFSIDLACSGLYSLTAFVMFATFLVILASTSILKKMLLFISGFLLFAGLNIIRLVTIVSVGYGISEEAAQLVHSFAGIVLIFVGMLLLLGLSDKILKIPIITKIEQQKPCVTCKTDSDTNDFCQNCGRFFNKTNLPISKTTFLKLTLIVLASSLAVLSFAPPTFAATQGSIQIAQNSNWKEAERIFPKLKNYTLTYLYEDVQYEELTKQDIALVYGYFPDYENNTVMYATLSISASLSTLHNWETCFITYWTGQGQEPIVSIRSSKEVTLIEQPPLIAKYLAFDSPKYSTQYTQATVYWYERVIFATESGLEQKYVRINLIILSQDPEKLPQYEAELVQAGQVIASSWERLRTQALMSLGVPALQVLLAASIFILILITFTQYFTQRKQMSNNLKAFQNLATTKEKSVLKSLNVLTKAKKLTTTADIYTELQKQYADQISEQEIVDILKNLKEYEFVSRSIKITRNAPTVVWKLNRIPKY